MRRRTAVGITAAAASLLLVAGITAVWPGLDAQQTPPRETTAWVLQADGLRYARVNTAIGELDTVRTVSNPSRIVESPTGAYMFTDSDAKMIRIDDAVPADLDTEGMSDAAAAPPGTQEVATAGDFVAYRTDAGEAFAGRLSTGSVVPLEREERREDDQEEPASAFSADAVAVGARGTVFVYSSTTGEVARFDADSGRLLGADAVDAAEPAAQISAAGDAWVVVDSADGRFWTADATGDAETSGTVALSRPDSDGTAVYLADETGLVRIEVADARVERVFGDSTTGRGTPARPVVSGGVAMAAWLPEGAGPGTLWTSADGDTQLSYGEQTLPAQRRPVLVDAGDLVVLNDARSGWVWSVPDGVLVPSSQQWDFDDNVETAPTVTEQEPPAIIDPRPPVAVDDAFGVRAGALVSLPVLLNDHDPNEDVLAIDPASVSGLDPEFGTLRLTDDRQRLAVQLSATASGTASFSYAVSDGTTPDGLLSAPAGVTLTVMPESENSAPVWCVDLCQQEWPQPEVARGGTLSLPVLSDWVDPDGDAIMLLSATEETGTAQLAATPDGTLVFQHRDGSGDGPSRVPVTLTIADVRGATTTAELVVRILDDPPPTVQSFAALGTAGSRLTIDVGPHVMGTAGDVALTAARVLDDAAASATVAGGTTLFDFSAQNPGTYRVQVTVSSGGQEATGLVRVTLLAPDAPAQLSTAPVVAFVRPQADATIDVLAAVSNPTGRVLLLSEVTLRPAPGATLAADAVGQSRLRVSGSTATGEPGLLGRVSYRVSDGSSDEGSSVIGEATVYLLPAASEEPPIAIDDAVVVRVGAQIDIPVLENDVAAAGAPPRLDPESIVSSSPDALAFAAGDVLRYLAPMQAGQYTVDYRAFTTGAPSLGDIGTVRIRVVDSDANRAPLPPVLSGRVLSGLSTTIPFEAFGMDPDGDVVRLDRIVDQPTRGSAVISADGTGIVYTSVSGDSGQDSFTYRVVDELGATGVGTVRIGILTGDASPAPVTYTDYVHVQAGADSVIRVHPLANDIDPMEGTLTLTAVRPDVPALALDGSASAEFERLNAQIVSVTDDTVTIAAGTSPSTMSFLYDVSSTAGNTARGLLVVRVVSQRVADYPVVEDTVLTAADRDDLSRGIDVLSGKVLWSGGDAGALRLDLWGTPSGLTVEGRTIRGDVGSRARIVPFAVTGETSSGDVTTYAFLRIPAEKDLALTLAPGTRPLTVGEGASGEVDLSSVVARPRGSTLEVGDEVRTAGARSAATCSRGAGTVIRYDAGEGAPWSDACLVPVRIAGQSTWTVLSVPVVVTPIDPLPILAPASVEVGPGETHVFDLAGMTSWQGRPEPVTYQVVDTAASFEVTLAGSQLTLRGADSAVPGTVEQLAVEVTSHTGVTPGRLAVRVGAAPSTLPQGGSATGRCSQAAGSSCTIDVVGTPGEVNPLPSTPLELVSVQPSSTCTGVSFAVASATRVVASWADGTSGAACTATFTVKDAQGRHTASSRDGRLLLDLQGFPEGAGGVSQSAYADGAVTLRVDPGPAQSAYPAVTGFEVRYGGQQVAVCTAQGICPPIAAPNGEQRLYEVAAVNPVGPSRALVRTTAWAYDPPTAPTSIVAAPVVTAGEGGIASLTIGGVDAAATGALQIASASGETVTIGIAPTQTEVVVPSFRVGSNRGTPVTITPLSRYEVPPGLGGPSIESRVISAHGIGAPTDPVLTLSAVNTGGGRAEITAIATAAPGGDGASVRYGIVREGTTCVPGDTTGRAVFSDLPDGRLYTFVLCAQSWFDGASFGQVQITQQIRAVQSGNAPSGFTFVVSPDAQRDGDSARWMITQAPTSPEEPPFGNVPVFDRFPSGVIGENPGIRVRYEHTSGWWQTAWAPVLPAAGSAPFQVDARWWVASCTGGGRLDLRSDSTQGRAAITFGAEGIVYRDAGGAALPTPEDPFVIPDDASSVSGIGVTVDWSAQGWGLNSVGAELTASCTPLPPPTDEDQP